MRNALPLLAAVIALTGCDQQLRPENQETRGRAAYTTVNGLYVEEWIDGHGRACTWARDKSRGGLDCDFKVTP